MVVLRPASVQKHSFCKLYSPFEMAALLETFDNVTFMKSHSLCYATKAHFWHRDNCCPPKVQAWNLVNCSHPVKQRPKCHIAICWMCVCKWCQCQFESVNTQCTLWTCDPSCSRRDFRVYGGKKKLLCGSMMPHLETAQNTIESSG